jgi:MFS family permease
MNSPSTHSRAIFFASFMTLIAAGMGFAIRGAILGDWEAQFGFTKTELGRITGGGLTGFGIMIIVCSFFADQIGYKKMMLGAFVLHVLSAVITLAATALYDPANAETTRPLVYECLFWGMFMFALANGLCETAINPLVATLYPNQKTHYLNILHAGWPGGLIVGGLLAWGFSGNEPASGTKLSWEVLMGLFLIPTLIYGLISLKEHFPDSEASAAGVSFGEMLAQIASPILLFLFLIHAMVGYVELGTDSWMQDIMKASIGKWGALLFVYTSGVMFVLRFFAGPIVEKTNPLGLLLMSSVIGAVGLYLFGTASTAMMIFIAGTVYGVGKTFLWPTMLGVVGERFPRGGSLTMGMVGGIGMLSAGLLGGPIIGYKQDYAAAEQLKQTDAALFAEVKSDKKKELYVLPPIETLDADKVGAIKGLVATAKKENKEATLAPALIKQNEELEKAGIVGGQKALYWTAVVPAVMAICYLLLLLYFKATGGYKQVHVHHQAEGAMSEL